MQGRIPVDNDAEKRSVEYLNGLVSEYLVFIDTCSWMDDAITAFVNHLIPVLQNNGKAVYLALGVRNELQKFIDDPRNQERRGKAMRAAKEIQRLTEKGLLKMVGDPNDSFTDNILLSMFNKFRLKNRMALVTQDRALCNDMLGLNNIQSSKGFPVVVRRINKHGYLSIFKDVSAPSPNPSPRPGARPSPSPAPHSASPAFRLCKNVTSIANQPLTVSKVPALNDTVKIEGASYRLTTRIGGGGEGEVFSAPNLPGKVIKIYNAAHLDTYRERKVQLMLSHRIQYRGICWPETIVQNQNGEFVGYVMPEARGRTPQRSIFIKPLFEKYFPNWKRSDLVQLCITILEKIEYLHNNNIIIGDINPENILIASATEVYFVDCDSYQVEGFPCPVGTVNFTAPELQGKRYDTLLRTLGNEYFSVATLLFMLMMPGKPPYSQQGGGSPVENIRGMDFSYPFGPASNGKQPDGLWRFMWSHLPYKIKEMFYNTFRKDAPNSTETTRFTTRQWLDQFREYKKLLDNGTLRSNDEQSEWIYPTRFKRFLTTCKTCGREVYQTDLNFGNCPECDAKARPKCKGCGEQFFSNQLKFGYCKDCNDQVVKTLRCQDPGCGKSFDFTRGDQLYYKSKGWDDPKRCPECRASKKSGTSSTSTPKMYTPQRSTYTTQRSTYTPSKSGQSRYASTQNSTTNTTAKKKKGLCFITTAVCEYLGKPDDCWELTLLRHFRDHYMRSTATGSALVEQYYEIAPAIVTALDASDQRDLIYTMLWQHYIRPCLRLIVDEKPEACQRLYQDMVEMLQAHVSHAAALPDDSPEPCADEPDDIAVQDDDFFEDEDFSDSIDPETGEEGAGDDPSLATGVPERIAICLCLDVSKTMNADMLDELNAGVKKFIDALNEKNYGAADICVVTFDSEAVLARPFCSLEDFTLPAIASRGRSMHIAKGVKMALDMLHRKKDEYSDAGIDARQFWLVLMTGGHCLGEAKYDIKEAMDRVKDLVDRHKLSVLPVCIGKKPNEDTLSGFSPRIEPLHLGAFKFEEQFEGLYEWLDSAIPSYQPSASSPVRFPDPDQFETWQLPEDEE